MEHSVPVLFFRRVLLSSYGERLLAQVFFFLSTNPIYARSTEYFAWKNADGRETLVRPAYLTSYDAASSPRGPTAKTMSNFTQSCPCHLLSSAIATKSDDLCGLFLAVKTICRRYSGHMLMFSGGDEFDPENPLSGRPHRDAGNKMPLHK